jgi:glycosyltransferase involved in cell wall biosynthesis
MMSEIWVPTDFHVSSFANSGVNPDKLVVMPESVDVYSFDPDVTVPLDHLPGYPETQDHFKFLSVFKWEARKGWDILARAFYEEFTKQENVTLYLLTNAFHPEKGATRTRLQTLLTHSLTHACVAGLNFTDEVRKIGVEVCEAAGRTINSLPRLIMIDTHIPQTDLPRLYKSMQAFVLPTRGEGWVRCPNMIKPRAGESTAAKLITWPCPITLQGRPLAEAMSMGLPVRPFITSNC